MNYAGLDVGTTGVKVLVVNEKGDNVASAYQGYPLLTPREGRWDPEILGILGIGPEQLSEILPSGTPVDYLLSSRSKRTSRRPRSGDGGKV